MNGTLNKLGFMLERELEQAVGIKDEAGLTIFLVKATAPLTGQKITLTIQIANVDRKHRELTTSVCRSSVRRSANSGAMVPRWWTRTAT